MRAKLITLASALLWAAAVLPFSARANESLLKNNAIDSVTSARLDEGTFVPTAASLLLTDGQLNEGSAKLESDAIRQERSSNLFVDYRLKNEGVVSEAIAQPLPSLDAVQRIQQELRELGIAAPVRRSRTRRAYPSITLSNPSGYGADRGRVFAGFSTQSRSRFSGGDNPGTIFGGGTRDGTAGMGFGVGDARESVGLQVSYVAASFGGSRPPLSGGLNAKVHKRLGNRWAVAVGGEGIINFGRLPENINGDIEFNDFENTYYAVATHVVKLREDFDRPFSRMILTGGAGTGRFRTTEQALDGDFVIAPFGSAAVQVTPWANVITEWTGQDLAAGVSITPFANFPLVITPAIRDIAGESDGDPRFVVGIGVSLSDIFSSR